MANIWEILNALTTEEKLWLVIWLCIQILPFVYGAIRLKKRMKVGQIDIYAFIVIYFFVLAIVYFCLLTFIGESSTNRFFIDYSGVFIGAILFFGIYNNITENVKKTWIIEFQLAEFNLNINYCFTYAYRNKTCIIQYNEEMREPFKDFFKRLLGRRIYLKKGTSYIRFTESFVNECILCTEWREGYANINIGGEIKRRHVVVIKPIQTVKYSQIEFLVHFDNYKKINEDFAELFSENMKIRRNVYVIGRELGKQFAEMLEEALFGNLTVQKVLESLETLQIDREEVSLGAEEEEAEEEEEISTLESAIKNYEGMEE